MFDLVGEISPVHRRISSAWRVTLVFRKMYLKCVFAVVSALPRVATVSAGVRRANGLASCLVPTMTAIAIAATAGLASIP